MYRMLALLLLPILVGCGTAPAQPPGPAPNSTTEAPAMPQTASKPEPANGAAPVASAGPQTPPNATEAGPSAEGFQLVALTDLIYIPEPPPKHKKGKPALAVRVNLLGTPLFRVLKDGKGPVHGFFDVAGTPVAPVWNSSQPTVVRANTDSRTGGVSFAITGPGKASVTVSVGAWSDRRELTIVQLPLHLSMSAHAVISAAHGFPATKTRVKVFYADPYVGWYEVFGAGESTYYGMTLAKDSSLWKYQYQWAPSPHDLWEYPQWPRCALSIRGERLFAVLTRPPEQAKGDAAQSGNPAARAPPERRAPVPSTP